MKNIRINKGYSQKYVSKEVLSQSAYSKFELNRIDILSSSYISLLNRMEVTHEEFFYIMSDYSYSPKQKFLNEFFQSSFNDPEILSSLIIDANQLLENSNDILITDIKCICEALIVLIETKSILQARHHVNSVWQRLSEHDNWYLIDIKLINAILFIFQVDTAEEIVEIALIRLKTYGNFQDSNILKVNLRINLSLLLIKSSKYIRALEIIEGTIHLCKLHGFYRQLAICYARKGICLNHLNREFSDKYTNKAIELLTALDENRLKERLLEEIKHYY